MTISKLDLYNLALHLNFTVTQCENLLNLFNVKINYNSISNELTESFNKILPFEIY